MSQKVVATSDLIKWCDDQVASGHKLALAWDGGGDNGWCFFKIDDEQVTDEAETDEIRELTHQMYDCLDYGSWAGEFTANGEAVYDSDKKAFVGIDYYSEDNEKDQKCEIKITVPKSLWFNFIEYNMEDENPTIQVVFVIRNGFLTEKHKEIAEQVKTQIDNVVQDEIEKFINDDDNEGYRSVWQNEQIARSEFKEEGDNLVYIIEQLSIGTTVSNDKIIFLELITKEDEY